MFTMNPSWRWSAAVVLSVLYEYGGISKMATPASDKRNQNKQKRKNNNFSPHHH